MAMAAYLRELKEHIDLVLSFARRDIRAKYKQTAFGMAWAVIQPMSLMIVFTLVFSVVARVPSDGKPYPLFAYTALVPWLFFTTSLTESVPATEGIKAEVFSGWRSRLRATLSQISPGRTMRLSPSGRRLTISWRSAPSEITSQAVERCRLSAT